MSRARIEPWWQTIASAIGMVLLGAVLAAWCYVLVP